MHPSLILLPTLAFSLATPFAQAVPQPDWTTLSPLAGAPGVFVSDLPARAEAKALPLPTPFPHIVRATLGGSPIGIEFNKDASEIALHIPVGDPGQLRLEIAEHSGQLADGRIAFSALDSTVVGSKAKLESHPGNHRIGFWTDPGDAVKWDYKATRWGMYDLAITYSLASASSTVEIAIGGKSVAVELPATGSWYRYTTVDAGRLYLAEAGPQTLTVTPKKKTGGAVMNLKAVLLTPAPEGKPVVQRGDETLLHARDATVHGTRLRYEPAAKKNCLGFWADPADWASWDFVATSPGRYRVLLTQGCGKGHGGSVVGVLLGEHALEFVVEDTGGFQNWKEREIGSVEIAPGHQRLEVRPKSKKAGAVMDIRQIRLVK